MKRREEKAKNKWKRGGSTGAKIDIALLEYVFADHIHRFYEHKTLVKGYVR